MKVHLRVSNCLNLTLFLFRCKLFKKFTSKLMPPFALQFQFGSIRKFDLCNAFRSFSFRSGVFRVFQITLLNASELCMRKK